MSITTERVALFAAIVLVLSLVGYPLIAPVSVVIDVPNRWVSVPFRAVVAILAVGAVLGSLLMRRELSVAPFWIAWWLFWALYIIRILIDGTLNPGVLRLSMAEYLAYSIGLSLLPALAITTLPALERRTIVMSIAVSGGMALLLAFGVIASSIQSGAILQLASVRQGIATLDPISFGHLGVTVIIVSGWLLVRGVAERPWVAALLLGCTILGLGAVGAGASRGPVIALLFVLPVLGLLMWRRSPGTGQAPGLAFFAILLGVIAIGLYHLPELEAARRLQQIAGGSGASIAVRLDLLNRAGVMFAEQPVLGAGIEPLGIYPHNALVESFLTFGILTGVLLAYLLYRAAMAAFSIIRSNQGNSWVALLFIQYSVGAMFSYSLYSNAAFWCTMALVVSQGALLEKIGGTRLYN
jgi:hypothetical protein